MEKKEFTATKHPSDLTDAQWEMIAEYFPQGPNSDHHKRSLIDARPEVRKNRRTMALSMSAARLVWAKDIGQCGRSEKRRETHRNGVLLGAD